MNVNGSALQKGTENRPFSQKSGVDSGQKITGIKGTNLGVNLGESGELEGQGSRAKGDKSNTHSSQATVFLKSVSNYLSTEEEFGVVRNRRRPGIPD